MPNIQFNYRYRDSANYKNHGYTIFDNPQNIELDVLQKLIESKLIDETYFYSSKWNIPNLFFPNLDLESDPTWHEFENIEYTNQCPNSKQNLADFIKVIELTKST